MGVVYLARDPLIGRLVALKTFRSGYSEGDRELQEFRARFLREAQSAGILNHSAIVTIHDVVDLSPEEGATFIAMEYVQGTNLKDRLQSVGSLDLRRAIDIVVRVAEGLDYAHERGVVHRDIKPANIILTREGSPKITDFGIARLDTSDLTQEGQLLGTPNYMAPERILGREVDHRTDIFSLGVLFYEMLTCHKPFQGDNLTMVTHRIVYEPFTPPEQFDSSIPAAVVAVLQRSMEKEPVERYARAGAMAEDLRSVIDALPIDGTSGERRMSETQDVSGQLEGAAVQKAIAEGSSLGSADPRAAVDSPTASRSVSTAATASMALEETVAKREYSLTRNPLRLLVLAISTLLLAGLVGWGALSWVRSLEPPTEHLDAAALARSRYLPMLQAARFQMAQDRPDLAAGHLAKALEVAPQDEDLLRFQREIEVSRAEILARTTQHEQETLLLEARNSLERRDATAARQTVERVLASTPDHEGAQALVLEIEAIEARGKAERAASVRAEESLPPAVEVTTDPDPVAAEFPLSITFFTEVSRGKMRLFVNDRLILNEDFKFVEKVGFLKTEERQGRIDASITASTGPLEVRVEVDPRGGSLIQGHFADVVDDGDHRVLEIRFDAASRIAIGLRKGEPAPLTTPGG
jgi:serine/threonine protein kinase